MLIHLVNELFKAGQVTLYVLEQEMQENIFRQHRDPSDLSAGAWGGRKHNYKKIFVGQSTVFAIFTEYQQPTFGDLKEAKQKVLSNKLIRIPLGNADSKTPQMILQVSFDSSSFTDRANQKKLSKHNKKKAKSIAGRGGTRSSLSPSKHDDTSSRASQSSWNRFGGGS